MAIFGIKIVAISTKMIQASRNWTGIITLSYIMPIPNLKKIYQTVFEISLFTDADADADADMDAAPQLRVIGP